HLDHFALPFQLHCSGLVVRSVNPEMFARGVYRSSKGRSARITPPWIRVERTTSLGSKNCRVEGCAPSRQCGESAPGGIRKRHHVRRSSQSVFAAVQRSRTPTRLFSRQRRQWWIGDTLLLFGLQLLRFPHDVLH